MKYDEINAKYSLQLVLLKYQDSLIYLGIKFQIYIFLERNLQETNFINTVIIILMTQALFSFYSLFNIISLCGNV